VPVRSMERDQSWVIVGLGNPGEKYRLTRHNLGFRVVDGLSQRWKIQPFRRNRRWEKADGSFDPFRICLVKPMTFMNLSGTAVREILQEEGTENSTLLVIFDDLNLPLGKLRIRERGGHGGHRGVESILQSLGTDQFFRLRLGIGTENMPADTADFVLSPFARTEAETVEAMVQTAMDASESLMVQGVAKTMSSYNC